MIKSTEPEYDNFIVYKGAKHKQYETAKLKEGEGVLGDVRDLHEHEEDPDKHCT